MDQCKAYKTETEAAAKDPMIIIAGPTAVGKSALSVEVCKQFCGEVISADSVQVYRGMDIGSAKITPREMQGIPHHLIDVLNPDEPFNVTVFASMAKECASAISARGHIPVTAGGTGFYIQALLKDVSFPLQEDETLRARLEEEAGIAGPAAMHARLAQIDPEAALAIPEGNVRRVIRAIEFYELSGEKISVHNERERQRPPAYNYALFVLSMERSLLYSRIEKRVYKMLEDGLVDEVSRLKNAGITREMTSMQALGYKEIFDYLDGRISLDEARDLIILRTRHFAKRQLTWFRREKDAVWLAADEMTQKEMLLRIEEELINRKIIG